MWPLTLGVCPRWTSHPGDWCGMFWLPHAAPAPHFFQSFSRGLGDVPSWEAPELYTSSNREWLIARQVWEHHQQPGVIFHHRKRRARETRFQRKMKTARLGRVWRGELYLQHTNTGWEPAAKLSVCRLHLSKAWVEFVFCFSLCRSAAGAPSHSR